MILQFNVSVFLSESFGHYSSLINRFRFYGFSAERSIDIISSLYLVPF